MPVAPQPQLVNEFLRDLDPGRVVLSAVDRDASETVLDTVDEMLDWGESGWPNCPCPWGTGTMEEERRDFTNTLGTKPAFSRCSWSALPPWGTGRGNCIAFALPVCWGGGSATGRGRGICATGICGMGMGTAGPCAITTGMPCAMAMGNGTPGPATCPSGSCGQP